MPTMTSMTGLPFVLERSVKSPPSVSAVLNHTEYVKALPLPTFSDDPESIAM